MAGEARPVLIQPEPLARPGGHYSHAVVANGLVFVSGQLPIAFDGAKLVDAGIVLRPDGALGPVSSQLVSFPAT